MACFASEACIYRASSGLIQQLLLAENPTIAISGTSTQAPPTDRMHARIHVVREIRTWQVPHQPVPALSWWGYNLRDDFLGLRACKRERVMPLRQTHPQDEGLTRCNSCSGRFDRCELEPNGTCRSRCNRPQEANRATRSGRNHRMHEPNLACISSTARRNQVREAARIKVTRCTGVGHPR
jgi:hypothetical protein